MTAADHSAAGPAAGFEQQRQLALVLLCEAYVRDPSVKEGRRAGERFSSLSRQRFISVSQRFISLSSHTTFASRR